MAYCHGRDFVVVKAREEEEKMNVLSMLQFSIVAGLVLLIGMWILYAWLRHTGRLPGKVTRSGGDDGY